MQEMKSGFSLRKSGKTESNFEIKILQEIVFLVIKAIGPYGQYNFKVL